jgi:LuxR family maltose regulon positive regulatory protein
LHRAASDWYANNGQVSEAIRHALAAADPARAANLIEQATATMLRNRQERLLLSWLQAIPDELLRDRPVLSDIYAGALLSNGQLSGVEARLLDAERARHAARTVVVDEPGFRRLPGTIAVHRAALALAHADIAAAVDYARAALDRLDGDDHVWRGAAAAILGLAAWRNGDLDVAHHTYGEGMRSLERAGHFSDVLGCAITLADIRLAQGQLREARRTYEQALEVAHAHSPSVLRGTADMYVGLSQVERERDNLEAAVEHLLQSQRLGEHTGLPQHPSRWRVAMARIRQAEGASESALTLLDEAERRYTSDFGPNVHPIAAMKARVLIGLGKLAEADAWARLRGVTSDDELSYLHEFEHITLARLLVARGAGPESVALLDRLLHAAQHAVRLGSVIEILVLQALVHGQHGRTSAALTSLEQALVLAEPEGYVRVFIDEGPPLARLLEAGVRHGLTAGYVHELLAKFHSRGGGAPAKRALIEPLSERELDVLRLLATDLDGPEIARELTVSLSTMRTHTRSIFNKLEVNSRRAAVRRAQELGIIS